MEEHRLFRTSETPTSISQRLCASEVGVSIKAEREGFFLSLTAAERHYSLIKLGFKVTGGCVRYIMKACRKANIKKY